MPEGEKQTWRERYTQARENMRDNKIVKWVQVNKVPILTGVGGASLAGITCLIMRGAASQPISSSITGTAGSCITGTRNKVVMSNVSFISANRQGSPSWVVQCTETGDVFRSQRAAALAMGINQVELSKHLNGKIPHANDMHFERICLAG